MGSVIDYIECPRCNSYGCVNDYYYKSGEEYTNCFECGYHRSFHFKRDGDGKFIKIDEQKDDTYDNLQSEEIHLENPFGSYRVTNTDETASCGTLDTEYEYEKFVSEIVSLTNQENKIKEACVSRLIDGKIEKEIIYTLKNE